MNNDYLMITPILAAEYNLTYIKEVAEMAGMYDNEIELELRSKGLKPTGDDEKDSLVFLSVILDSYKKELEVYLKTNPNSGLVIKPKVTLSWKNVFNTDHKIPMFGDITEAIKATKETGYSLFVWNGRVYDVNVKNLSEDLGTLKELGLE